jgi:hypothetical protein
MHWVVIPAKAGIQSCEAILDPGLRRGDGAAYTSSKVNGIAVNPHSAFRNSIIP